MEYIRHHWLSTRVPREACPREMSLHGGEVRQNEGRGEVVTWFVVELVSLRWAWVRNAILVGTERATGHSMILSCHRCFCVTKEVLFRVLGVFVQMFADLCGRHRQRLKIDVFPVIRTFIDGTCWSHPVCVCLRMSVSSYHLCEYLLIRTFLASKGRHSKIPVFFFVNSSARIRPISLGHVISSAARRPKICCASGRLRQGNRTEPSGLA